MIERLDVVDLLFFRGTGRGAIFSPHLQLLRWTMRRMLIWKSNTTTMKLSYASRRRRKRWGGCSWEKEVEGHTFAMCGCSGIEAQLREDQLTTLRKSSKRDVNSMWVFMAVISTRMAQGKESNSTSALAKEHTRTATAVGGFFARNHL